ncbi:MAG: hypothetical protein ACXAB6_09520, partial [Candidatus Thorarchaeota archaeon]
MANELMTMKYEFFSWRGFFVGVIIISFSLALQSVISFPQVWIDRALGYTLLIISSALIVGVASGSVLIFLFPPDQDVIGVAGIGSDDLSQ